MESYMLHDRLYIMPNDFNVLISSLVQAQLTKKFKLKQTVPSSALHKTRKCTCQQDSKAYLQLFCLTSAGTWAVDGIQHRLCWAHFQLCRKW